MAEEKNIIIGAGLSGLTAAYTLANRPTNIHIFETSNLLGGRITTINREKNYVDMGAQFFSKKDSNFYKLVKELSLENSMTETNFDKLNILFESKLIKINPKKYHNLNTKQTKELTKFKKFLLNCNKTLKLMPPELFLTNFKDWYYENIGEETIWFPDALLKSITFTDSTKLCAFYGLLACQSFFIKTYTLRKGLNEIINKLKYPLENTQITKILFEKNRVESIMKKDNEIIPIKKGVIAAIPSNELCKIVKEPDLSRTLKKITYNGCSVLIVKPKNNITNNLNGILTPENKTISAILINNNYYTVLAPYKHNEMQIKEKKILKELDKLNLTFDKKFIYFKKWDYGLPEFNKNTFKLQQEISEITNQYDNFAICGDFMGLPSLDACVESAKKAAEKLKKI
ncbi:MAG: oleate hydratase [archaeon]|jgi:protoporphyrinogen oxidase